MTTERQRAGNRLASRSTQQPSAAKISTRKFPIQGEIQKLEDELNAFNERIAELEDEGHRSHAMDVLKGPSIPMGKGNLEHSWRLTPLKPGGHDP
jgi:hypothetical protein